MSLNHSLIKKLQAKFEPSSMIDFKFRGNDVMVKTNQNGDALMAFIGKKLPDGSIKGDRYSRTLIYKPDGSILKDHWEMKGKAS